jgi:hypothetical protein
MGTVRAVNRVTRKLMEVKGLMLCNYRIIYRQDNECDCVVITMAHFSAC